MYNGYSSYGGGYSGMSSSYGGMSSYGSSYGGYGGYGTSMMNRSSNNLDPNKNEKENPRKQMMGEYFQMMGGLRSMLQIGFAIVAFGRFTSQTWNLLKKIFLFLAKTSISIFSKLFSFLPKIPVDKLLATSSNSKHTKANIIFFLLRIVAALLIAISYKMKKDISTQVDQKHKQMFEKYEDIKKENQDGQDQEIFFQKQGYF